MYSMEAALDEERRMVLELLENAAEKKQQAQNPGRNESPHPASPRSPTRSLLNPMPTSPTGPRGPPRRSMLDVDTAPRPPRRSMLDFDEPAMKTPSSTTSPPPSIAESTATSPAPRTSSDSSRPNMDSGFRPITAPVDYTSQYQFGGIITAKYGQDLPKRNTQGGKKTSSLLSEALSPSDSHPSALSQESRGRHHSSGSSMRPSNSKSPHRLAARSKSPRPSLLSHSASMASPTTDGVLVLDSGQSLSGKNAFQILSERNLVQSGVLPATAGRKSSAMLDGEGRLQKDYLSPDGEEVLTDSSDADEDISSDEENRGRKTTRRARDGSDYGHSSSPTLARQPQSLLAAAEEERVHMSAAPKSYRSLLEPTITVTTPHGDRYWSPHGRGTKVGSVHPDTSFDEGGSGLATPVDSDTEEIKRAQNLSFSMTGIISQPESHRAVRIIYRGEYGRIQQQANEDQRRLRKYLVASDLSDESTHALEWAVGTVLRDGDTLVAICCIDEESGIVSGDTALVPDDPKAIKEQAAAIRDITASATGPVAVIATGAGSGELTASPAPSGRGTASAAEAEREKAVTVITDKITKLLRRTQLQVRVIVEVLHCKNPKHLITEVIDFINPTLVILGSRGRSALKGVILGSFSNYLVTKSSVPVMVARKRLRKTSKYKRAPVRQVNNLETSTARLAAARID